MRTNWEIAGSSENPRTLVRALLVPALMAILGKWNWWLPRMRDERGSGTMASQPIEEVH